MNLLQEQLALITTQFHWLRPLWLVALLPLFALLVFLWRQKQKAYQWQDIIAPELLPFLTDGKSIRTKKSLLWGLAFAWLVGSIALAGPSWIKRPTPVEKNQNALVILLDLSISMYSEDIKPSRIVRARLKISDILRARKDGQTAMVVYAGEAHTVTPMSDDSATIISLLPSLQPNIMPLQGSNTEDAVARGIQLLHDAGATQGDLLLITDGVVPEAFGKIQDLLAHKNIHLSILGVGGDQPAPVPGGNGGFLHDKQGNIITTQLNSRELNELAQQVGGRYHDIANTNSDIDYLLPSDAKNDKNKPTLERDFDQWFDQGHWLVFLLLPIVLFSFRRGLLICFLFIPLMGITPTPAYAFGWDDLWLTKDQQAARAMSGGDAKAAAEKFESPEWKASAEYRAGDYAAAAEDFAKSDTALAHYNRGNALAKSGKLEDALKAYDEALKRDPSLDDAKKNRDTVEKLLKQKQDQQKNSDKNNKDKNQDNKDQSNKDQNNKDQKQDEQNKDQQNDDQKNKDEQNKENKDQQNKDQQNKDQQDKQNQQNKDQNSESKNDQQKNDQEKDQQQQNGQQNSSGNNTSQNSQNNAKDGGQSSSANSVQANAMNSSSGGSSTAPQMAQASSQSGGDKNDPQKAQAVDQSNLTDEQKQALEQWLRRVPDDPGGLLRNKFKWQYLQNRQKRADGEFESPANHADQRL